MKKKEFVIAIGKSLIRLMVTGCMFGCNGQPANSGNCETAFKTARINLDNYYSTGEEHLLRESLNNVQNAIPCEATRRKAIELKTSVLVLLKRYEEGFKFIDSLESADFKQPYKKKMSYNFFRALESEAKQDTATRNKLLNEVIAEIEDYVQHQQLPQDKIDEEVYSDLFLVRSKVFDARQLQAELESLKKRYPNHAVFFDALWESFAGESKPASAVPVDQ